MIDLKKDADRICTICNEPVHKHTVWPKGANANDLLYCPDDSYCVPFPDVELEPIYNTENLKNELRKYDLLKAIIPDPYPCPKCGKAQVYSPVLNELCYRCRFLQGVQARTPWENLKREWANFVRVVKKETLCKIGLHQNAKDPENYIAVFMNDKICKNCYRRK